MSEQFFDRISEGMDILDMNEEKIGTVGKVLRPVGVGSALEAGQTRPTSSAECYVEMNTGVLGWGETFYIPSSHIRGVSQQGVLVDVTRSELKAMDWTEAPSSMQD